MRSYFSILKIVLHGRSAGNILLATLVSFTFSISVILCTFGLMDGFDHLLKSGLRHSSGDILITSPRGFFMLEGNLAEALDKINPRSYSGYVQTEAFALREGSSKGVLVKGVEGKSFSATTGLTVSTPPGSIVIGKELAKQLQLEVGTDLAITFAKGNDQSSALPVVKSFRVSGIVTHGIYQKDLRFVYVNREELTDFMNLGRNVNTVVVAVADPMKPLNSLDPVR
jgi:ABC-type lipoprotein release transport system permease subunit